MNVSSSVVPAASVSGDGVCSSPSTSLPSAELTERAYRRLLARLAKHGNKTSDHQRRVLRGLVSSMTGMARGELSGRWAFGLPTGFGKTSAVVSWIAAAVELGVDDLPGGGIAVGMFKVESLCQLKRDLIAEGVPAEKIGLLHSYQHHTGGGDPPDGFASEPATEGEDRPIMLVTHQRVRSGNLDRFHLYRGEARRLMLYDESLVVSQWLGVSVRNLRSSEAWLREQYMDEPEAEGVLAHAATVRQAIEDSHQRVRDNPARKEIITVPWCSPADLDGFKRWLTSQAAEPLREVLAWSEQELRVLPTSQGAVVSQVEAVPAGLHNLIVLDASYPIRPLVRIDPTLRDAEQDLPAMRMEPRPSRSKDFSRVVVHQCYRGGGRHAMEQDFGQPYPEQRRACLRIVEVIRDLPEDEAVLIFVFKDKNGVRYEQKLRQDLAEAGIDLSATVPVGDAHKPRIRIATWGMETSLNRFAYCSNVILAGVLHLPPEATAAGLIAQRRDLRSSVDPDELTQTDDGEVAHVVYQALSRGSCRVMEDGRARPMKAWLIDRSRKLEDRLTGVMPGVQWKLWRSEVDPGQSKQDRLTQRILDGLRQLEHEDETKIKIADFKSRFGLTGEPNSSFHVSRDAALDDPDCPWSRPPRGRTFFHALHGFGDESGA